MSHIRWSERRGALQSHPRPAAFPPLGAAKTTFPTVCPSASFLGHYLAPEVRGGNEGDGQILACLSTPRRLDRRCYAIVRYSGARHAPIRTSLGARRACPRRGVLWGRTEVAVAAYNISASH